MKAMAQLLVVATAALVFLVACEAKVDRHKNLEMAIDLHLAGDENNAGETHLIRSKRTKRHTSLGTPQQPEAARSLADEPELNRVKRTKRETKEDPLHRLGELKTESEKALQRVKRQKRAVGAADEAGEKRRKRSVGKVGSAHKEEPLQLKRFKRGDGQERKRRASRMLDEHQPMEDIMQRAAEKLRRMKRRPRAERSDKLYRNKRGSNILAAKRSEVLKDITRDITRLERLRRGIAHAVIHDSKRHGKSSKGHNIVKRRGGDKPLTSGKKMKKTKH